MELLNTLDIVNNTENYSTIWDDNDNADSTISSTLTDLDDDDDDDDEDCEDDIMSNSSSSIISDYSSDSGISINSTWLPSHSSRGTTPQSSINTQPTNYNVDSNFLTTVSEIARDLTYQTPAYTGALIDFTATGLVNSDPYIRRSAAVFLWQLLRSSSMPQFDEVEIKEKITKLLKYSTKDLTKSLEIALELDSYSDQMLYWVSGCFHYISRIQYGCEKLWNNHIKLITNLLGYNLQAVVFYTVTTLHNMLLSSSETFQGNQMTKCIELLIEKLHNLKDFPQQTQSKLLAILIDCLANICYHNESAKVVISQQKSCNITKVIEYINVFSNNEKLLLFGLRLLKILSTNCHLKVQIAQNDAYLNLINKLLDWNNFKLLNRGIWSNMLWTLRNLSDCLFRKEIMIDNLPNSKRCNKQIKGFNKGILQKVCILMEKICRYNNGNDVLVQCVAGILANASCDCVENKQLLVELKVPQIMLECLQNNQLFKNWSGETLEALYRCMHHLCSNHLKAASVVQLCFNTDLRFLLNIEQIGIENSFHLPYTASNNQDCDIPILWTVLRAWLGLVRHLCVHPMNDESDMHSSSLSEYSIQNRNTFFHKIPILLHKFKYQRLDGLVNSLCSTETVDNHKSKLFTTNTTAISNSLIQSLLVKYNNTIIHYLKQLYSSVILIENLFKEHLKPFPQS